MAKRSFSPSDFPQAVSFAPHVLIDRKGNQWLGRILEPAFTIKTEFQTIVIKRKKIQSIVYKNEPTFEQDRLITLDGTVLNGVVRPPLTIRFRPEDSSDVLSFRVETVLGLKIDGE